LDVITPKVHLTLPEHFDEDDRDEERHFAPIIPLLEGLIKVNEWHLRRSLRRAQKGLGPPLPPLYASRVRYKEDKPGEENWKDIPAVLADGHGDCLPLSTHVLRDDYEMVPLYALRPGDRIAGDGAWTQVHETMSTGEKEILSFRLSNGCSLRCSPEHRLFRDVDGKVEEICARDARVGDDLVTPQSIPMASSEGLAWPEPLRQLSEEDRAWLLGVFVADGWTDGGNGTDVVCRAAISGRDGKPKEAQKRRVEALMQGVSVATRWHEKYIAINDRSVAEFFAKCGQHAPEKRLNSLRFASEATVRAVLDGLSADASFEIREGKTPGLVYGTTSSRLVLQLRVLYRMLGISVSVRRVDDHGGFGENPIYRVIPRLRTREGYAERREKKFARVRSIADGGIELCGDITTDSGKFWLPESDVLVHNCDRLVAWRVAELRVAGYPADPVIKWRTVPKDVMVRLGHPAHMVPEQGIQMVHVCVGLPGWRQYAHLYEQNPLVEDPSKRLGMGGKFTSRI
jgi:hypothetical protein